MHQLSDGPALSVCFNASVSSSNLSTRKVRLSDRELYHRVQRVVVPDSHLELQTLSSKRGWKRIRIGVTSGMKVHFRLESAPSQQCQVVCGGEIRAHISEVLAFLRAPTESESNALLRALYGSHFIYSSLLHAIPNTERCSLPSSSETNIVASGQQLMVRTASFAHKGLAFYQRRSTATILSDSIRTSDLRNLSQRQTSGVKNEQCCYIELLTPTQEGFKLSFCTLDAADVLAGKAPPDRVIPLHPMSGWLIAEPSHHNPEMLQITCQAAFPGNVTGGCDVRVAQDRLIFLAKGICRLEKVLRRRRRHYRQERSAPGRVWQALLNTFRVIGVVDSKDKHSDATHHNWYCIACTRPFLPTLRKNWRRCDLCAYRVCDEPACCSHEQVAIYNRYIARLSVCARCRECINERESDHRTSGNPIRSSKGDFRYTGVSLRYAGRESDFEPDFEMDRSDRSHGRWGPNGYRRLSGGLQCKRRTQSDPPPMLTLAFSSSGDESNSPATDAARGARTQR
ncbi:unnamed protein product [Peronospora belbahrii]|uniref:FYVE-type domain-containing protein n=1 Tax=Peronospora belbahrii TaxID=622444 RepID=A0AAU9L739_9STRA|nr:unnamed protein product [Peronospora belbahrii]